MNPSNKALLFLSWAEDCSRSDGIAARLGGQSRKIYSPFWGSNFLTIVFKYAAQTIATLRLLRSERPRAVIVMTPPVAACLAVWLYSLATGAVYAIDAHTGAFLDPRWKRLIFLHRFFSRRAVTTLVTNEYLAGIVKAWGASATLVPDVPVVFPEPVTPPLKDARYHMTFVSSFTWDEPLDTFLEAATLVPEVSFYVTGKIPADRAAAMAAGPSNVSFTGFMPRAQYAGLLMQSDAVISLTTLDHTMQRAAYEATYLGKPVITSKFALLEREFNLGAVHVENNVESIVHGVRAMCANLPKNTAEAKALREVKIERWKRSELMLRQVLLAAP